MMIVRLVIAVFACLLIQTVQAARLEAPYVVDVPVASQSAADRLVAEAQGLQQLLLRLTGQPVGDNARVREASEQAERYVASFSYVQAPAVSPGSQPAERALYLRLVFAPAGIDSLLREAGLSLWPLDRPQLLVLVTDDQGSPLPGLTGADALGVLREQGRHRGLPLQLPVLDAIETEMVMPALLARDVAAVATALASYPADAWLLGSVSGSDEAGWQGQWVLRYRGEDSRFEQRGATLPAVFDGALLESAALLSGSYRASTTADNGPAQLRLQIEGVTSFAAFSRLRDFLERLDVVDHMAIVQVNGSTVIADVDARGRESFRALVALLKPLQWREELPAPPGADPAVRTVWRYQWIEQ